MLIGARIYARLNASLALEQNVPQLAEGQYGVSIDPAMAKKAHARRTRKRRISYEITVL